MPGGAQDATCFAGPPESTAPCQTKKSTKDGQARFSQTNVPSGEGVSLGVKITPGLVADNKPHMEPNGSKLSASERVGALALAAVTMVIAVGSPIVGVLWWRKNGRDQRYAYLAPGTTPLPGQQAWVVPNDPEIPIPVAFSAPPIPMAEAGVLIDGQVDSEETAATIIDLAVRGALTVQSNDEHDLRITLLDPSKASTPHEMVLLTGLFEDEPPGAERDLSRPGSLASAHEQMRDSVRNQVAARGWFRKVPLRCRDQQLRRRHDRYQTGCCSRSGSLDRLGARAAKGAFAVDPTFADHHHCCCDPRQAEARAAHRRRPCDV